ncbi:MAG: flagellar protein FlgN [Pseudobdellovibrio sp.]
MDSVSLKKIAYDKLASNLEEILKYYRSLLDCVRKEKDLLIAAQIEQLNESNAHKEQLTIRIKALDQLRITYATELAQILQADSVQPRLLEIAQKIGGAEGEKLRTMHSALEMVIKRLSDLNRENSVYAQSALRTVSSALDNFKDQLSGQKTYQNKGKYKSGVDTSGHFVAKKA